MGIRVDGNDDEGGVAAAAREALAFARGEARAPAG